MRVQYGLSDRWGAEPATEAAWYDIIGRFKQAAAEFDATRAKLQSYGAISDPTLASERDALLSQSVAIESQIRTVRDALKGVMDTLEKGWAWVKGAFGLSGELNALPLIPIGIGVVVAATSAIVAWNLGAGKTAAKLDIFKASLAAGKSPDEAAAIVERMENAGALNIWKPFVPPMEMMIAALVIGGFIFYKRGRR